MLRRAARALSRQGIPTPRWTALPVSSEGKLPAEFGAGRTHIGRYHPMPANRVGARGDYVWLVKTAMNAETELVIADAVAPIRLRRHALGAQVYCTEMLCRLVLLDVVVKRESRATDRCLLVKPSAVPDTTTQLACAGAPKAKQKLAAITASAEPRQYAFIGTPPSPVPRLRKSNPRYACLGSASIDADLPSIRTEEGWWSRPGSNR
jgi:hypothetical protein